MGLNMWSASGYGLISALHELGKWNSSVHLSEFFPKSCFLRFGLYNCEKTVLLLMEADYSAEWK